VELLLQSGAFSADLTFVSSTMTSVPPASAFAAASGDEPRPRENTNEAATGIASTSSPDNESLATQDASPADGTRTRPTSRGREPPKGIGILPCIEQPARCLVNSISQPHRRLTSTKKGGVQLTKNRGEREQFFLLPVPPPPSPPPPAAAADASSSCTAAPASDGEQGDDETQEKQASEGEEKETSNDKSGKIGMFYLKSFKFGRYLTSQADGTVSTVEFATKEDPEAAPDETAKWMLMRSPHGGHFLVSALNERNLACGASAANSNTTSGSNEDGTTMTEDSSSGREPFSFRSSSVRSLAAVTSTSPPTVFLKGNNDESESWQVELVTGELCFITAPSIQKQLRCDMMGTLTLTSTSKGWEVWRFIESGGGKLRICSWMHSQHFVCCHPDDGRVVTCSSAKVQDEAQTRDGDDRNSGGMDEWYVEAAPGQEVGVVIRSASSKHLGDFLFHTDDGVFTSGMFEGQPSVWHLNAGHSQKYSLASLYNSPKTLGPFPYVTDNKKQLDEIVIEQLDVEGTVMLYHLKEEKYLGSDENGEVSMATVAMETELWKMDTTRSDGGYTFASVQHEGRMLSYQCEGQNEGEASNPKLNPKLCTVVETGDDKREVWRVDPVLPRAVSSGKIKTFAIGTSIAVGTTIAMPFAMAGLAAVVGTESILMGVVTVGLTSAEAIASVGASKFARSPYSDTPEHESHR